MGPRTEPDRDQSEVLYRRLVLRRPDGSDPLAWFAYLEDREALLDAVLGVVRREKWAMIAEAVAGGMSYRAVADRVGLSLPRVQAFLRKAKRPRDEVSSDA